MRCVAIFLCLQKELGHRIEHNGCKNITNGDFQNFRFHHEYVQVYVAWDLPQCLPCVPMLCLRLAPCRTVHHCAHGLPRFAVRLVSVGAAARCVLCVRGAVLHAVCHCVVCVGTVCVTHWEHCAMCIAPHAVSFCTNVNLLTCVSNPDRLQRSLQYSTKGEHKPLADQRTMALAGAQANMSRLMMCIHPIGRDSQWRHAMVDCLVLSCDSMTRRQMWDRAQKAKADRYAKAGLLVQSEKLEPPPTRYGGSLYEYGERHVPQIIEEIGLRMGFIDESPTEQQFKGSKDFQRDQDNHRDDIVTLKRQRAVQHLSPVWPLLP